MARSQAEPLSAAEWKVMKIIWRRKRCAARDVYEEAGQVHGWAPSTVKTLLRRLVEKGHLKTTRVGNSFLYRPAGSAMDSLRGAADSLLGNALDGTVGPLLAYMARRGKLSAEELAELQGLLDELTPAAEDEP
ncbi:MAG: BlaI/MecI/CopY family transcriptional regulator [Thermoguttaceae bacterium]